MSKQIITTKVQVARKGAQVYFTVALPNICYTTDILFGGSPLDNKLLGFIDDEVNEPIMSYALLPFVAAQKREPEQIRFVNNYMLYGYYRDEIGLQSQMDISYTVNVYLHLVINN